MQNNSLHSSLNRVKCETQILPSVGFAPTTFCICGKRLTARLQNIHSRPRLTLKYIEVFLCKGTRQKSVGRLNRYSRKFEIAVFKQVGSGRLAGPRVRHLPKVINVGQVSVIKTRLILHILMHFCINKILKLTKIHTVPS